MKKLFIFFKGNQKIEIQTVAYSFNLFLPSGILIFLSIIKEYEQSAEIGIIISINYLLTQIFSSNARSLIIAKNNIGSILLETIIFRILTGLIISIVSFYLIFYFDFYNKTLLLNISLIIIFQWIIELILLGKELKKNNKYFLNYILFSSSLICLYFVTLIILKNFSVNILIFYNISLILIISYFLIKNNFKNYLNIKNIFKIFINSVKNYSFYSSFFIQFTNLIWRILILTLCGKILAGIYFSSFAIGSLPATIFNNSFGPTIHKKKLIITNTFKNIIIFYFLLSIFLLVFSMYLNFNSQYDITNFHILTVSISMIGSFFMIKGTSDRQNFIQNTKYKNLVFKVDVIYSLCLLLIVPALFFLGGKKLILISFLVASLFSYLIFSIILKKIIKNK